jgi:DNA-binding beta-propeller fold protein YncE
MVIVTRRFARRCRMAACLASLALGVGCAKLAAPPITAAPPRQPPNDSPRPARDVVLVGNNWEGTVVAFEPNPPFRRLATFDVVPDRDALTQDIRRSPKRRLDMALIRRLAGEGHDQLVDDVFTSIDGRYLYASRPSYKDVVAIDLTDAKNPTPHWRRPVEGRRADHAAISADGTRLLVSASTANKVHEIDTATGRILRSFPSGDEPHESNYSHDQTKIFHASIGRVFLPVSSDALDRLKGDRVFEIVDAKTFKVDRFDMREKTKSVGPAWKDSAVRPMAISRDDKWIYLQMSFLHGFYEFNVEQKRITRMKVLPGAEALEKLAPGDFQLNSADHGITLSGDGQKLCVAGTMTGEAYVVDVDIDRKTFDNVTQIDLHDAERRKVPPKPYWATTSADGKYCYISASELNQVVVISFDDMKVIGRVNVGPERKDGAGTDAPAIVHPQRVRNGRILVSVLESTKP